MVMKKGLTFSNHTARALNLTVLRVFVQPFIAEPPSQLDTDVLSYSLNRLCNMGLEFGSKNIRESLRLDPIWVHYYEVMPVNAFPKCEDVMDCML